MMKLHRLLFAAALFGLLGFSWPWETENNLPYGTSAWLETQMRTLKAQGGNIDPNVLRLSLIAYQHARKRGIGAKPFLTVIDYSKPSTEKRLWVFDLKKEKTLFHTWVTHGKNSGGLTPSSFSNRPGSLKSSIGVFMTDEPYVGGNGYSLRLRGLEHGVNDNALKRDIVIHGAWYVNPDTIRRYGQIGRSWGCPAVSANLSRSLIDTIKEHTIVFAYYPDSHWLSNSRFLAG